MAERGEDRGYCYGVEDGLDGYCVHTSTCREYGTWGASASGPNSTCIRPHKPEHFARVCTCGHPGLGCYCRG